MSSVLVVNEISTEREEIARALEAEGFTVVQASSAAEAVREIWGGSFIVAIVSTLLTGTTSTALRAAARSDGARDRDVGPRQERRASRARSQGHLRSATAKQLRDPQPRR